MPDRLPLGREGVAAWGMGGPGFVGSWSEAGDQGHAQKKSPHGLLAPNAWSGSGGIWECATGGSEVEKVFGTL